MHTLAEPLRVALEEIESEAEFVLFSEETGLISEHCTQGEARMAYFQEAGHSSLGAHLPVIYRREETSWVSLS